MGFGKHPHDNMEIISIPLKGALKHNDTTGRNEIIQTGDVQIMSAGTGISHSEVNASRTEDVNFLQLWIFPKQRNIAPRYEQKTFDASAREKKLQTVVSPEENSDTLWINQDAWLSLGNFKKDFTDSYEIHNNGNGIYVFVIEGEVTINGQTLSRRDGMGIEQSEKLEIKANSDAEILVIEVPM
jgi:redox-sensitive bicupin YhaK (pirin superfamily)